MKVIFAFCIQMVWVTGFAQSLSLQNLGVPFKSSNLVVQWNLPTNALPSRVWVYHLLPREFPARAISNLIVSCKLNETDKKISNTDGVLYKTDGKLPTKYLEVFFPAGSIWYATVSQYGPTNLAQNVPPMGRMPELTTNFLSEFGIAVSDVERKANGTPNFRFWEPVKEYFLSDKVITNVEFRAVDFRRSVDGFPFISTGTGGGGEIEFGENGEPVKIDLSWRNLKRYKSYPTATPETIVEWIRQGKAVQGGIPMNLPPIDWSTVKALTVKKAEICYYAGNRLSPSQWLMPLVSLWTTVDTGNGTVDVEINCPVIDEGH